MPRKPIDYSKTIIYKIVCKDVNVTECYVGSTTDFRKRKYSHKHNTIKEKSKQYNFKVYRFIRDNGNWDNWDMIMIEKYPCNDELEKNKRERFWIEHFKSELNCSLPSRTIKEWREGNKEKNRIYCKEWRDVNKDENVKKKKIYYEKNKDEILKKDKLYYETNRDEIVKKRKLYREKNKDAILKKQKEKYNCDCGSVIRKSDKSRHYKSKKHQDFYYNINTPLSYSTYDG